jgi:hypothetical protein
MDLYFEVKVMPKIMVYQMKKYVFLALLISLSLQFIVFFIHWIKVSQVNVIVIEK